MPVSGKVAAWDGEFFIKVMRPIYTRRAELPMHVDPYPFERGASTRAQTRTRVWGRNQYVKSNDVLQA
jgi:hypothetical protein